MNRAIIVSLGAAVLLSASPAQGLTLTNLDDVEQRLQIVEGLEDPIVQDYVIAAGQTLEIFCEDRCTIIMENGEKEDFEGFEVVGVEDGRFTIAE